MIIEKFVKKLTKEERQKLEKDKDTGIRNSERAGKKGCFGQSEGQKYTRKWLKQISEGIILT